MTDLLPREARASEAGPSEEAGEPLPPSDTFGEHSEQLLQEFAFETKEWPGPSADDEVPPEAAGKEARRFRGRRTE